MIGLFGNISLEEKTKCMIIYLKLLKPSLILFAILSLFIFLALMLGELQLKRAIEGIRALRGMAIAKDILVVTR